LAFASKRVAQRGTLGRIGRTAQCTNERPRLVTVRGVQGGVERDPSVPLRIGGILFVVEGDGNPTYAYNDHRHEHL
jgi:hypothetical protein